MNTSRYRRFRWSILLGTVIIMDVCSSVCHPGSSVAISPLAGQESSASVNRESAQRRWDFDAMNDSEGWTIPDSMLGGTIGGAIWLRIQQGKRPTPPVDWQQQVWVPTLKCELASPAGLAIPATSVHKVRMRVLNLSPETDGTVFWRTADKPDVDAGPVRFSMKPDCKEWQEVVCHIDDRWQGVIDQIRIRPASFWWRGDLWIDWIAITDGDVKATPLRPDLCSDAVVPWIAIPGLAQKDFQDAFKVLDECLVVDVPLRGFNYPFLAPGGAYGENWWQLDGSLNIAGAKWVNQKFVDDVMRGFIEVQAQNPDGRIDLEGKSPSRGQVADVSSIPRYFEAAYDVARRTGEAPLRERIRKSMMSYLDYWFSPAKQDPQTGLIKALFEETFGHYHKDPDEVTPVDLNVAVAVGCYNVSVLSEKMDAWPDAGLYRAKFNQLRESINRYLWNEETGGYYNYNLSHGAQIPRLLCTTFDPLRLGIAPAERIGKLIPSLLNPALFNWGTRPVTSIAMTEPDYVEAAGPYDGRAWFGDIWTMRNLPIIAGLEDAGRHDLAAELNWSTITTFHANYSEYAVPSTGSGEGVQRYGWTASQYLQAIIEHLFGVDYDRLDARLRVCPHIPQALIGHEITIRNLIIPTGMDTRLDVTVTQTAPGQATIFVNVKGQLPQKHLVEIFLPKPEQQKIIARDGKGKKITVITEASGVSNMTGVRQTLKKQNEVRFELSNGK